jgi:hypothetical protein
MSHAAETGVACRPSRHGDGGKERVNRNQRGVEEMADRYRQGRDIWTGELLRGQDAVDWRAAQFERAEDAMDEDELERTLVLRARGA